MVETSGSWFCQQQRSPWVSSPFESCMIAPVEHRQHEFLPASVNPLRVIPTDLNANGYGFSGFPDRGLLNEAYGLKGKADSCLHTPSFAANELLGEQTYPFPEKLDAQALASETPSSNSKRFVIFDQSGDETRLIFSPQCPWMSNLTNAQPSYNPPWNHREAAHITSGAHQFLALQSKATQQACFKTPIPDEGESGENETIDEGSEMHEDTEDIDALLYSDDDGASKTYCDDEDDDDEASTGHSPLVEPKEHKDLDFDEVASIERDSKRQKGVGGSNKVPLLCTTTTLGKRNVMYENVHGCDLVCAHDKGVNPTIGSKRPREDKIRDTLKVLENIIPGSKNKDPLVILDEAIDYLKSLKYNAQIMHIEDDPNDISSSCYGPPN